MLASAKHNLQFMPFFMLTEYQKVRRRHVFVFLTVIVSPQVSIIIFVASYFNVSILRLSDCALTLNIVLRHKECARHVKTVRSIDHKTIAT